MLMEMTDAELLAKAMVWAGVNERCDGQAFNITNGDFNRWENVWPRLAEFFKLLRSPPAFPADAIHDRQGTDLASHGPKIQSAGLSVPRRGRVAVRRSDFHSTSNAT